MTDQLNTECDGDGALEEGVPNEVVLTPTVQLLKGFADDTRLRILCLLRDREVCVHEIVDALDMSQSAVSHQLRVLRDARLVSHRRDGRHVYYRLADDHVREMLENALSHGAENE
ncbi:transcriptional regulator [Salinibacter sp. 10B]|uniref:ArsR/SmtB family transcription factor n=1 Tax=Salinibacter sp. 10B TaxID=1923971 RepID=UPI000CF3840C|nr:metalloregulator ArsR/SmtB family transcription factor [Salinibacter sp. 10B]PQJ35581.1 transcriptional regulator [Salinibacter sp. 10B]